MKKSAGKNKRYVVTGEHLIRGMCKEIDKVLYVIRLMYVQNSNSPILNFTWDTGVHALYCSGIIPAEVKRFDLDLGHPWAIHNAIKAHILSLLHPNELLIEFKIEDATDEYWDFTCSMTVNLNGSSIDIR